MFNPSDTFPYIGLRPFSEEDSLYFKGRDEQITQLTALLEANKFLMVTGASGDGKSSLVYAGLVPNARAGFFNAKFTNWVVADFRPERMPLHNLSKTVSRNLRIGNEESAEVELRRGFSSLVELYLNSSLFLDEQSEAWASANGDERDFMQRNAANLLIVADQFEEFFTNPENYYRNSPSSDSQLVINLLLETARISIAKNLPIYIVCTMRSDYIGQCAAFRGLPEFIGFSQFFVPRLKRKEMVQVVKEPAGLHGDKISNRLVERVVYDLGEGIDQLPVLEHAMNEVWIQAKNGSEELDLIHYAMAGGMASDELPPEDRKKFNDWFSTLPSKLQEAYQHPGLSHIIDTHANKLYLSAADHYNQKHEKKITAADAQLIIKVAFICLTKMDEERAVRNRMTLQEITDILAKPEFSCEVVGGVLNIFRETGNTFLRPYITDEAESHELKPDSVLDITHESLIRNWELLLSWAKEENDHLAVYQDFRKQMDRWLSHKKSIGFLLPIGPLTFFEHWHSKLIPNKYWVNRYLDPGLDKDSRINQAQDIIVNTNEFLMRSARRVRVTRLVVKYGASKIAALIGSILILALCGFYYRDAQKKTNENILKTILNEGEQYLTDPRFKTSDKADFIIMKEFMEPGSFKRIMDRVPFDQQFELIRDVYGNFTMYGGSPELKQFCLYYGDSVIRATEIQKASPTSIIQYLKALNVLIMTSTHYLYNHHDERIDLGMKHALTKTKAIMMVVFNQGFESRELDMATVNDGIENMLNNNMLSTEETNKFLSLMSPFENTQAREIFDEYFHFDRLIQYSNRENFKHNAGYQQLAYLYGSIGKVETVKSCVDSLLKYHSNYSAFRMNILNIATYLFQGGYLNETEELLSYYALKQNIPEIELYELWLDCAGHLDRNLASKIHYRWNHNANIELMSYTLVNKLYDQYYLLLRKEYSNPDDLNFNLALYYKKRAILLSKICADKKDCKVNRDSLFSSALESYHRVSKKYLNETSIATIQNFVFNEQRLTQVRRRADLFLYPDHFPRIRNERNNPPRYFGDFFFSYCLEHEIFNDLYTEEKDFELLNEWIFCYDREGKINWDSRLFRNFTKIGEPTLSSIDSIFTNNPIAKKLNANRVRLVLADYYIDEDNETMVDQVFQRIDVDRIKENFRQGGPQDQITFSFRMYRLAEYFALKGKRNDAIKLAESQSNKVNAIKVLCTVPLKLLKSEKPGPKEDVYVYLDSAITEFNRIQDFAFLSADPRIAMVLTTALVGGKSMTDLSHEYVQAISINQQSAVMQNLILGTAMQGDYYKAYSSIPEIALIDRLFYFSDILSEEGMRNATDPEWKCYFESYQNYWIWEIVDYEVDIF